MFAPSSTSVLKRVGIDAFFLGEKVGIRMGTGASRLSGVSHDRLLQATRQPRAFFDELFQVFLKHITPKDLLALSNPSECQKYVFVMADAIQSTFQSLKISTTKDKRGVILFQKTGSLTADSALHRDNCVAVAYFYIRLFQIIGAIMLTCVDNPKASAVRGVYDVRSDVVVRPPQKGLQFYRGGAKFPLNGVFDGNDKLVGHTSIMFNTKTDKIITNLQELTGREIFKNHILKVPIKDIQKTNDTSYTFSIGNPDLKLNSEFNTLKEGLTSKMNEINDNLPMKTIYATYDSTKRAWLVDSKPLVDFLYNYIVNIVKVLLGQLKPSEVDKIFSGRNNYGYKAPGVAAGPGIRRDSVGSIQALSTQSLQDLLSNKDFNQVSLCVARGIQLLGADSMQHVQKVLHSDICKTKLGTTPKSLPTDKLANYEPLRVLDQLYYDKPSSTVRDGAKVGSSIGVGNQAEYDDFLKKMSELFGSSKEGATTVEKFEGISVKPRCTKTRDSTLEIKEPAKIRKMTEAVNKMFAFQTKHTQEMYKFIQTRIVIYRADKGFAIHPSLMVGGVDALNQLAKEVRAKLVNYYSTCEGTYKTAAADAQA